MREIIHMNVTLNPNRDWLVQQFKNIAINDEHQFPEHLIIDNDQISDKWIDALMKVYFQIKVLRIVQRCPWQNGRVEGFIKTLKVELLYRIPSIETHQIQMFCHRKKLNNNDELSTLR